MEPQNNNPGRWTDLRLRALSGAVLLAGAYLCIAIGGIIFNAMILLCAILMMKEWEKLVAEQRCSWRLGGYAYVIIPCASLIWIRSILLLPDTRTGFMLVITLVAIIPATDIGGYFTGKQFGSKLLAPTISPKKTWEGLGGAIVAAIVAGLICAHYILIPHSIVSVIIVSALLAIIAQTGDLFESYTKRRAGVKDSGTLIPGHGGLIDRLDGYMFAAPFYAFIVQLAL